MMKSLIAFTFAWPLLCCTTASCQQVGHDADDKWNYNMAWEAADTVVIARFVSARVDSSIQIPASLGNSESFVGVRSRFVVLGKLKVRQESSSPAEQIDVVHFCLRRQILVLKDFKMVDFAASVWEKPTVNVVNDGVVFRKPVMSEGYRERSKENEYLMFLRESNVAHKEYVPATGQGSPHSSFRQLANAPESHPGLP